MISNNLKDKVRSISNETLKNTSDELLVARIISANEKANICDIDMALSTTGQVSTFKDVPVASDESGVIGWFPTINELVYVMSKHNSYKILCPANSNRHHNDTIYNVLTNFFNYTMAGNNF